MPSGAPLGGLALLVAHGDDYDAALALNTLVAASQSGYFTFSSIATSCSSGT